MSDGMAQRQLVPFSADVSRRLALETVMALLSVMARSLMNVYSMSSCMTYFV